VIAIVAITPEKQSSSPSGSATAVSEASPAETPASEPSEATAETPAAEPSEAAETPSEKPIADQIKESLSSSGGFFSSRPSIPAEKISDFSFGPADLQLTINVGDWWSINAAGLRTHLYEPLATFRRVVDEFPQIERIRVSLVSPAAEQRDQYGNVINSESVARFVELNIDCEDLRKFPKDFDWMMYPVYAAHRYLAWASPQVRDLWDTELLEEMKLGGFSEIPKPQAATAPDAP
jgi:hypothetical protein